MQGTHCEQETVSVMWRLLGFVVAKIVSPTENIFCLRKKEEYILHNKPKKLGEKTFLISKGLQNTMNIVFILYTVKG